MAQNSTEILDDLITFYKKLLIPYMKIRRDMPFPTEPGRMETDGEHAFSLSMVALSLNERLEMGLDNGKLAQYALVHDLVEVHAGDTSVKASESDHAQKEIREHEAYKLIEEDFADIFPWVHTTIALYESKKDEESKFIYVVDKYMGALSWLAGDGKEWAKYYPDQEGALYKQVVKRLREKATKYTYIELVELFDVIHDKLEQNRKGYYRNSKQT